MDYEKIISELNEITNSLDATTAILVGLQENVKHEDFYKKIKIDLFLEAPIQELSCLANQLTEIAYKLNK